MNSFLTLLITDDDDLLL